MKLINIPGTISWINPEHIIKVTPDGPSKCIIYLTDDNMVRVNYPLETTVRHIQEATK